MLGFIMFDSLKTLKELNLSHSNRSMSDNESSFEDKVVYADYFATELPNLKKINLTGSNLFLEADLSKMKANGITIIQ